MIFIELTQEEFHIVQDLVFDACVDGEGITEHLQFKFGVAGDLVTDESIISRAHKKPMRSLVLTDSYVTEMESYIGV